MKLYLSSFKLGDAPEELAKLMPENKKIAYIPNAGDYTNVNLTKRAQVHESDMEALRDLGLEVEMLDLKEYFGKQNL